MNYHVVGIVMSFLLALVLQLVGPPDSMLPVQAIGGVSCNHSDIVSFDCVEINGRQDPCTNPDVGADNVQTCLDTLVSEDQTVCQQNNCQNVTKKAKKAGGCTSQNCGGGGA